MAIIHIDNREYQINKEDNLLKICLTLGLDIPYFCWHPELGSIGACRQCAVKQYQSTKDTRGYLVMSCMTQAYDGILISINDKEAQQFRKNVIECLMINHPHDCPVCEEGGNCHLQDMTVMVGHSFRRYRFTKRTHNNQYLGPFISHEMNRCITCYRCLRYYKDYADGHDLNVYGVHDNIYFGRIKDGILESEFSGNLIEICPTGVFTDKTNSQYFSRKWDIQFSPSICQQCSLGCNIILGERYGKLCRVENRYNGSINRYFLCDRGRFGHNYVNLKNRPYHPIQYHNNNPIALNVEQAIQKATNILRKSKRIIGIGSTRASIENNFALRELVGEKNFYIGITEKEQEILRLVLKILYKSGIYIPTLYEIESYDAILILGEDLTQTAARAALSVRQAVKNKARKIAKSKKIADWHAAAVMNIGQYARYPLFITSVDCTRLDDISTWTYHAPIEDQARLGFAIAHFLDNSSIAVEGLDYELQNKVKVIARTLAKSKKPLIISGTNTGSIEIIKATANIIKALKKINKNVGITMIADTVNSIGLGMIGGGSLEGALCALESNSADCAIILENDIYYRISLSRINSALSNRPSLIVIDHQYTAIMDKADIILSAASFTESDGTVINNEGRAQRFFRVYDPTYYDSNVIMLESWRWLRLLYCSIQNCKLDWIKLDDVINAIAEKLPYMAEIKNSAPDATFRIKGQKIAREPHCYSGRNAMLANINVHEPRQPLDKNTMFTFSMEGNNQPSKLHSQIPFVWAPGWNSLQAWNKFQDEVGGHLLHGDPGIRLIKISSDSLDYFIDVPQHFKVRDGIWRIVLYHHLFGSDELSQRLSIFQDLMPKPYVKLNSIDAAKIGASSGSTISFISEGQKINLPLIISDILTSGQIGLPLGINGITSFLSNRFIKNLKVK